MQQLTSQLQKILIHAKAVRGRTFGKVMGGLKDSCFVTRNLTFKVCCFSAHTEG
jgi:hypothetical protein